MRKGDLIVLGLRRGVGEGEADGERAHAASGAGHGRNVGDGVVWADALDQLVEIEDEQVPAALLVAQRVDLHVARLDGAKGPVAHAASLAPGLARARWDGF